MCIRVSGRICVPLRERNSGQVRVDVRMDNVHYASLCVFLCVSFIKRRVTVMEERKRDDPWLGSRGKMKKREERDTRKIEGDEEKGQRRKTEVAQFLF